MVIKVPPEVGSQLGTSIIQHEQKVVVMGWWGMLVEGVDSRARWPV